MPPLMTEQEPLQEVEQITPQQLEFKLKNVLEEYLKDCCFAKWDKDIRESIPAPLLSRLLSLGYDKIVEESKRARIRTATLFAQFIRMNMLPLETYCAGLEEILEQVDDLTVESPKIWEYLAEMVAPLIYENTLPLEALHASCEYLISQGNAGNFLGPIFKLIVSKMGPNYLALLWHSSELIFEDFLPNDDVNMFIKDNQLEFLVDGVSTSDSESALTFEEIHEKLLDFFKNENSFDDVSNWITVNVGNRAKDKQFIQVLATAVFENSIAGLKLNDEILRRHYKILLKYIDGNLEYEGQLLSALHAHINKLENPEGLFLKVFLILHKDSMLSSDSIAHWASNKDCDEEKEIDQSSPCNTTGKKVYDKEFLLALRNDPKSKRKPDNLPNGVLRKIQGQIGDIIIDDVLKSSKSNYRDQLSPSKTTASKVYDKDFLLALRNHPKSKKKPDNLLEAVLRKGQIGDITDDVPKSSKSNYPDQQSSSNTTGKKVQKTKSKKKPEDLSEVIELIASQINESLGSSHVSEQLNRSTNLKISAALDTSEIYVDRPISSRGTDYHVGLQAQHPKPPNKSGNPLNSEIKVPQMQQPMNLFMQQPVKGGATQSFYTPRGPPPQNQIPRMGNHQQIPGKVQPIQPMYIMPYYGSTQRPMVQQFYRGQYATAVPYPQAPSNAQGYHYFIPRPQTPLGSASKTLAQSQTPPATAANINQNLEQQASQKKRRAKAIPIIDADTGKDKLSKVYDEIESHPPSGESSARQKPQPMYIPNKEVQNAFTKPVNLVISQDKAEQPTGRQNTGVPVRRLIPSFFMNLKKREESSSSEDF